MTETLHPEEQISSFLLIRHGHTRATEEGRLYTDPEASLTEKGLEQAGRMAAWLSAQKPDVLLTSRARRVRSTAEIIAQSLRMEPEAVEGLDEWRVGDWDGRTYLDIKKSEPDLYRRWSADPIHNAPPGGESIVDLLERVKRIMAGMVNEYAGRRVALVTHAGVIRSFLVCQLGMPAENFWRLAVPTGTVSRIDVSANFATLHYLAFAPGIPG